MVCVLGGKFGEETSLHIELTAEPKAHASFIPSITLAC